MIRCHDDQRVLGAGHFQRRRHRQVKRICIAKRARGIDAVMSMVDAATFNHQDESLLIARQAGDRRAGQIGQRRLGASIARSVQFILHVRGLKQT